MEGVCLSVCPLGRAERLREVSADLWSPGKQHFPKDSLKPGVSTGGNVRGRLWLSRLGCSWRRVGAPGMLLNTPQCLGRPPPETDPPPVSAVLGAGSRGTLP